MNPVDPVLVTLTVIALLVGLAVALDPFRWLDGLGSERLVSLVPGTLLLVYIAYIALR